jgi:hypothetical protein
MSEQYETYLHDHRHGLKEAFEWLKINIPELFENLDEGIDLEHQIVMAHDSSKDSPEEYEAYDKYWYGGNKSYQVVHDYDIAWLHHIHNNPHHWQYWVFFKHDDPMETITIFEMPFNFIIELICDWWSFGWSDGDLNEIFTWYDERKDYIKLGLNTRKIIEGILDKIKKKLEDNKE